MYILLILFSISLLGIIFMIGRKLILLENGQILNTEEITFEVPYMKEVKHITVTSMKTFGHISLVETIRFYIRSSNFIKNTYQETKIKIKNQYSKKDPLSERKEISKFLKVISDYKHKIREIKHRIHEEEKSL